MVGRSLSVEISDVNDSSSQPVSPWNARERASRRQHGAVKIGGKSSVHVAASVEHDSPAGVRLFKESSEKNVEPVGTVHGDEDDDVLHVMYSRPNTR